MECLNTGRNYIYATFVVFFGGIGGVFLLSGQDPVFACVGAIMSIVAVCCFAAIVGSAVEKSRLKQHGQVKWYDAVGLADDPSVEVNGVWNVFLVLTDPENPTAQPIQSSTMSGRKADRILGHKVPVYVIGKRCWVDAKHYDPESVVVPPILKLVREEIADATVAEVDKAVAALCLSHDEVEVNYGAITEEIRRRRQGAPM